MVEHDMASRLYLEDVILSILEVLLILLIHLETI